LLSDFFFPHVFGRFSVRGVQKHHSNIFAKSPCRKKNPGKINKTFDVSFSSIFFGFIAFSGASQRWEFKNTTKNVLQENRVGKFVEL
jgi:hypothetical protein